MIKAKKNLGPWGLSTKTRSMALPLFPASSVRPSFMALGAFAVKKTESRDPEVELQQDGPDKDSVYRIIRNDSSPSHISQTTI